MTSSSSLDPRRALVLFAAALAVFSLAALGLQAPGYMDAEYYFGTGRQLALGNGFSEPFVWNYLADPQGLPAPSHAYWMPLASLVAAAPMAVFGISYRAAQILFIVVAALVPVLAARTAFGMGAGDRAAWISGGLAILGGFFLPYFVTTDTFALYALIGGAALWQMGEASSRPSARRWSLIGALIGLGHLSRADGLLLWVPAVMSLMLSPRSRGRGLAGLLIGYAAVMVPWWARNLSAFGSIFPPGVGRTLWLLDYDELFTYPASLLTPERWWSAGWPAIVQARIEAGWTNVQTILAVNGYVVLLPLALLGGWDRRRHPLVRIATAYLIVLFVFMTVVFPFAGSRGGFFHSSAALMPLFWALTAIGAEFLSSHAPRLGWQSDRTKRLLFLITVVVAGGLSIWNLAGKAGLFGTSSSFLRNAITYSQARDLLLEQDPSAKVVAVVNPPGFESVAGISAVALPHGSIETLEEVLDRYGVDWVLLEADHPRGMEDLYEEPSRAPWGGGILRMKDAQGRDLFLLLVRPVGRE